MSAVEIKVGINVCSGWTKLDLDMGSMVEIVFMYASWLMNHKFVMQVVRVI